MGFFVYNTLRCQIAPWFPRSIGAGGTTLQPCKLKCLRGFLFLTLCDAKLRTGSPEAWGLEAPQLILAIAGIFCLYCLLNAFPLHSLQPEN